MKIVIDTNTLVSGFLWEGPPAKLVATALASRVRLYANAELLLELQDVLQRPKFAARLAAGGETPATVARKYRDACVEIASAKIAPPENLRDAEDVHILACAVAAEVDLIVSGDKDLQALKSFQGIPIVDAAEALVRLKGQF